MAWTVEYLNERVREELDAIPADMQAKFFRIAEMFVAHGPMHVREPYVKSLGRGLYEMRMSGRDGICSVHLHYG